MSLPLKNNNKDLDDLSQSFDSSFNLTVNEYLRARDKFPAAKHSLFNQARLSDDRHYLMGSIVSSSVKALNT